MTAVTRKPRRALDRPLSEVHSDAAWTAALRWQQFSFAQIAADASISESKAAYLVRSWVADGKVRPINKVRRFMFEVIPEGEITVPAGDLYDQLWTAARKLLSFTVPDLVVMVQVDGEKAELIAEARTYIRALVTIDYVRVVKPGNVAREAIYRLITIKGAQAPRLKRIRCIIDPNVDAIIPLGEGVL